MTVRLALLALLVAGPVYAQAPGMQFGGVCLGPRGAQEACPGESITCRTVMTAINDELSLFHARITTHPAGGDQVSEFVAPPGGGIDFTDPDSASFSFVTTVAEADRGTTVFVRVDGEAQVLRPFNGCCATGSWGVFYDVPADCPVTTSSVTETPTTPTPLDEALATPEPSDVDVLMAHCRGVKVRRGVAHFHGCTY